MKKVILITLSLFVIVILLASSAFARTAARTPYCHIKGVVRSVSAGEVYFTVTKVTPIASMPGTGITCKKYFPRWSVKSFNLGYSPIISTIINIDSSPNGARVV